jgi:aminoglycoside phosphotransferase (APT) family kinase protein
MQVMDENLRMLQYMIPSLRLATKIEKLAKGFSADHKYIVHLDNGKKYLLRISTIKNFEKRKAEFETLQNMIQYGVKASKPIEVGQIEELQISYSLLSYLEGEDAMTVLPQYTEQEQYQIGFEAGQELARMHKHHAPVGIPPWNIRVMNKLGRYLKAYKTYGLKIKNDDKIIAFIEENEKFIKGRPNHFQHDDFHVGNMIIHNKQYVGTIDFNNCDWGDPLHDFYKLALYSKEVSIPFSIGQVEGYLQSTQIPESFWVLYSLYVAMNLFSTIVWSFEYTPDRLDEMYNRLNLVIEDHDYFKRTQPFWFLANR